MKLKIFEKAAKVATKLASSKHSSAILTGITIAGTITAVVLATKAGPEVKDILEDEEMENKDKVIGVAKKMAPAAACAAVSIASVCLSKKIADDKLTAAYTALMSSREMYSAYEDSAKSILGPDKEKEIRENAAKKIFSETCNDGAVETDVALTGNGNVLVYDPFTSKKFRCDANYISKCVNELNFDMQSCMYVTLGDLYDKLGLKGGILAENVGWEVENGPIDLNFTSFVSDTGEPCLVMDFYNRPTLIHDRIGI